MFHSNFLYFLQDLAETYSAILNIETEECLNLLRELQKQSLQRLEERNVFRSEGLASLRVKISGQQTSEFSIQLKLSDTTDDLKEKISAEVKVPFQRCESYLSLLLRVFSCVLIVFCPFVLLWINFVLIPRIKLICNGKVLKNGCVLDAQNIKHGNTILALVLQSNIDEDIVAVS